MAKKTALGKDPKQNEVAAFDPARAQRRVDYLKKTRPNDPEIKRLTSKLKAAPATPATPPPPTPQDVTERGFRGAADLYGGMVERFKGFDPMQAQAQYEPVYSQEMERARQNVMGQFERRNAEEFARQQEDVQRQIVERGLDPNSPAAQALYKQLNVRQDLARQEAMSSAEQAAQGIQQQMYGQAMGTATMPYDIYGSTFAPTYMAGVGAQYNQQQLAQQQEYAKELAALENKYRLQQIRATPRGGGGQAGPTLYEQLQANQLSQGYNQQPQQNPLANVAQGVAQGVGAGITQGLIRGGS